jgi:DNA-directed RNA polymerase specialized sigma24 family protein
MKNRMKKLKGGLPFIGDSEDYDGDGSAPNPFLAALANPDILSEDARMFPERDFDEEEARAAYLESFKKALATLTPKQRAVIDALLKYRDQQKVADVLGIARPTVAVTLRQIQKKVSKVINKTEK